MLETFVSMQVKTSEASIHLVKGGSGYPLLLLHGYPQTHVMWHKIAPRLAETFTVVLADLRGYGDSSKPEGEPDHGNYAKRAMAQAEYYLRSCLQRWGADPSAFTAEALAEYLRCFRDPASIHATCEDYRAAASIDLQHDEADMQHKVSCPLLVLWGEKGFVGRKYDVLATWRERADHVQGQAIPSGHFLAEEAPEETYKALQ